MRLRECDYGTYTQKSSKVTDNVKATYVETPFPSGKSYQEMAAGMKTFLVEVLQKYDGKRIMVIGSRATQYGLEHWINDVPLAKAVAAPWSWQPGWVYRLRA